MSARSVTEALQFPPSEVGHALIALVEDQWFDRKSARERPAALAVTLVAMANAEGGTVVIGIHSGRIEGTDGVATHRNDLIQASIDHAEPPVRVRSELVPCITDSGGDNLLVIHIEPSEVVHTTRRDECYLRVGDEDRRLRFGQRQELIYDKGQAHFDGTVVTDAGLDDLDPEAVAEYLSAVGGTDLERTLTARLLLDRSQRLTAGGYLLFGSHPQDRFPEAYVRVLRYRGTERATGRRQNIVVDLRCEGPITRVLEAAILLVEEHAPRRQALGASGRFELESLIPRDAWLEGLVNAVVHRSYSLDGDHIRVEIFDDRIEVESPGRFPGVVAIEDPRGIPRFARNPRMARVCADLRFGQELGEGIRRIYDEMRAAGLTEPSYRQRPASVVLVLAATALDRAVAASLPSRSREVMELIRDGRGLSTSDVADALALSRPSALRRLHALEGAGMIEWVGQSKKDPRAYWRLKSE